VSDTAVPDVVRQKALLREGGERWLAELPELVAELARRWDFVPGAMLPGGSESLVVEAGPDAVLKLELPTDPAFPTRARQLAAAQGRGYVRVLAYDVERNALLLERLGPALRSRGLPVEQTLDVLVATLEEAWQVEPEPGLRTALDKAASLEAFITERSHPTRAVEVALEYLQRRSEAFDPHTAVVLHGDAHAGNALAAPDGRYRFVDPEFFYGEKAYDLAISIREWDDDAHVVRRRCGALAERGGSDADAIWEWGYVELVSTGLFILQVGEPAVGERMLATAERRLTQ
jgi:streptomycin 6-kinase